MSRPDATITPSSLATAATFARRWLPATVTAEVTIEASRDRSGYLHAPGCDAAEGPGSLLTFADAVSAPRRLGQCNHCQDRLRTPDAALLDEVSALGRLEQELTEMDRRGPAGDLGLVDLTWALRTLAKADHPHAHPATSRARRLLATRTRHHLRRLGDPRRDLLEAIAAQLLARHVPPGPAESYCQAVSAGSRPPVRAERADRGDTSGRLTRRISREASKLASGPHGWAVTRPVSNPYRVQSMLLVALEVYPTRRFEHATLIRLPGPAVVPLAETRHTLSDQQLAQLEAAVGTFRLGPTFDLALSLTEGGATWDDALASAARLHLDRAA